jgi:hypothetical protein
MLQIDNYRDQDRNLAMVFDIDRVKKVLEVKPWSPGHGIHVDNLANDSQCHTNGGLTFTLHVC